jgi:pimeloyl-ACP methyl ester carboxylesterase
MKTAIISVWIAFLGLLPACGQSNGTVVLDQIVTNAGDGSIITVPSVTPSQSHEAGFLLITGSFPGGVYGSGGIDTYEPNCTFPGLYENQLMGVSPPWPSSFHNGFLHGVGPLANTAYTEAFGIMDLPTSAISATATTDGPPCFNERDWSAALVLVKNQNSPTSYGVQVVSQFQDILWWNTSNVVNNWGGSSLPRGFLIGYLDTYWDEGAPTSTDISISDAAGNNYQIIDDSTIDPEGIFPGGSRRKIFICPQFYNPSGTATVTAALNSVGADVQAVLFVPGVPTPSMIDPVPNLISGSSVTTDPQALAASTKIVGGVAADGVAEAVIRVPTASSGERVTITLINDQNGTSGSVGDDGGLSQLGSSSFASTPVSVTSVDSGQGAYAFAIYRAPIDFVRQNFPDGQLRSRSVSLQIQNQSENTSTTLSITIVRPPVILVHGYNDSLHAWDKFMPLTTDTRFKIGLVDYSRQIGGGLISTSPSYPDPQNIIESQLGLRYNAPRVLSQVKAWIDTFRGGSNPVGMSVAAVQADIVGHSMGGLVTRRMVLESGFLASETFGQGNIHKLITIDTPHLGSQLAYDLLGFGQGDFHETGCLQQLLAKHNLFTIGTAVLPDGTTTAGASGDLQGDDATTPGILNDDLAALNGSSIHPIPWAPIEGQYTNFSTLDSLSVFNMLNWIHLACLSDPLAGQLTSTGWPQLFHGEASDGIVSVKSQANGGSAVNLVTNEMHSPSTEELGFKGPSMLDAGVVPNLVTLLLNTPLNDPAYYSPINP